MSIVGANFSNHSTVVTDYDHNVVTMWSPRGCNFNDLMFGLLRLYSGRNVVTNFRPLFVVTICSLKFDIYAYEREKQTTNLRWSIGKGLPVPAAQTASSIATLSEIKFTKIMSSSCCVRGSCQILPSMGKCEQK